MKSGKLIFKKDITMGEVVFPQDWMQHPYVFRLDCIRDWMFDLQKEFDSILEWQEKDRVVRKAISKRLEQTADKIAEEIWGSVVEAHKENKDEQ